MTQIVLMMAIGLLVAMSAFVTVNQAGVQALASSRTELNRRLDMAAQAVQSSMTKESGMLMAGVKRSEYESSDLGRIPNDIAPFAKTPWGTSFRYCPIAASDYRGYMTDLLEAWIPYKDSGSYKVITKNGYVVYSELAVQQAFKDMGAVAIITAPLKPGQSAPDCTQVTIDNDNNVRVANGLARAVFAGDNLGREDAVKTQNSLMLYASQLGSGNFSGKDANNRAPINAALSQIITERPMDVKLNLFGQLEPNFNWYKATHERPLNSTTVVEGGTLYLPNGEPGGNGVKFLVRGDWTFSTITMYNFRADVDQGATLRFKGPSVNLYTVNGTEPQSTIFNRGRVQLYFANVRVFNMYNNWANSIIWNEGDVNIDSSYLTHSSVGSGQYYYVLVNGGNLSLSNGHLGRDSAGNIRRTMGAGIANINRLSRISVGYGTILGQSYVAMGNGGCWYDDRGSLAFKYSRGNTVNSVSDIPPESEYAPAYQSSSTIDATYKAQAEERRQGRAQNPTDGSNRLICV